MDQILLNGISLNELLEKISQLIDTKIEQVLNHTAKNHSKFISRAEVAELLKITLPTLNEWSKLGWLKSYKMGNRVLYKAKEVEEAFCKLITHKHKKGGHHGT
jgi:excisionase family DNA binding protein